MLYGAYFLFKWAILLQIEEEHMRQLQEEYLRQKKRNEEFSTQIKAQKQR